MVERGGSGVEGVLWCAGWFGGDVSGIKGGCSPCKLW